MKNSVKFAAVIKLTRWQISLAILAMFCTDEWSCFTSNPVIVLRWVAVSGYSRYVS